MKLFSNNSKLKNIIKKVTKDNKLLLNQNKFLLNKIDLLEKSLGVDGSTKEIKKKIQELELKWGLTKYKPQTLTFSKPVIGDNQTHKSEDIKQNLNNTVQKNSLSQTERMVLHTLTYTNKGLTYEEIAKELKKSPITIKIHIRNIINKGINIQYIRDKNSKKRYLLNQELVNNYVKKA